MDILQMALNLLVLVLGGSAILVLLMLKLLIYLALIFVLLLPVKGIHWIYHWLKGTEKQKPAEKQKRNVTFSHQEGLSREAAH